MKRTRLHLLLIALSCVAILSLGKILTGADAQTVTDEVTILPLPVPPNVIGTFVRGSSADGKRLVFDSINNYNGKNVDSNTEIYVYDVDSRSIIQITDTVDMKDPSDTTGVKILTRIDNTTPVMSGDGTKIAFVSNAAFGDEKNDDGNFEIYLADLPRNAVTATIKRITDTEKNNDAEVIKEIFTNYSPAISDDGGVICFASTRRVLKTIAGGAAQFTALKEGPNNSDPDGNGELFLYNVAQRQYSQVTASRDVDATVNFVVRGFNINPSLSGNGRVLVFLSGFNYPGANASKNTDFNGEIFLYKVGDPTNIFTQVTETSGVAAVPANFPVNTLPAYTHPLSFDGSKMVLESAGDFAGKNSDKTREIYLADLTVTKPTFRQLTEQTADASKSDFGFLPSLNSAGTFITFTSTINLTPATTSGVKTDNADGSKEVFRFDIANSKFRQLTFTPTSSFVLDQRTNGTLSFANNTGDVVSFSLDAQTLEPSSAAIIDVFQALVRNVTSKNSTEAKLANAASYDATQVARSSIVAAFGTQLANATQQAPSANLPFELGGVTVNVGSVGARLIFVSPGQINFVVPAGIANGETVDFTINNNGVQSAGKAKIVDVAPGVFTTSGDGKGAAAAQCGQVSPDGQSFLTSAPPCSVGNESQFNILIIYGTGWRNTANIQVKLGDQTLTPSYVGPQPDFLGLDQINLTLTKELAGKTDQDVTVVFNPTTPVNSNVSKTAFKGFENALVVSNAASFEAAVVANDSIAAATGTELADSTASSPVAVAELAGVRITVGGLAAGILYVSPTQVNFIIPGAALKEADLVEVVVNNKGKILRGRTKVLKASPGVSTTTSDGNGRALAKCGKPNADGSVTFSDPPCSVGTEAAPNILRIFGTGWRNADKVKLKVGDVDLEPTFAGALGGSPGVDIIDVKLTQALAGKTDVDVIVTTTVVNANRPTKAGIKISFQ